jgi:hypothetical protein
MDHFKVLMTRVAIISWLCVLMFSAIALPSAASEITSPSIVAKTNLLLDRWKPRLDEEKLNALVAAPFVIAGDGGAQKLARYRDGTILAAARALKATYFQIDPTEPIVIFLFESEGPYKRLAGKWFPKINVPHFGFYLPAERVMFMNVATGTGTLVHELTHALIAPDFPAVPSWFNEGLASLYEQCSISGDTITGHENWRLPALQRAIRENTLRPLKELIDDPDFYRRDLVGLNYAEARYLMFHLQEKKLLSNFYRDFRDHVSDDPRGLKALARVIAPQQVEDFEKEWRSRILELQYK